MTTIEILLSAGAAVTAFGIGASIQRSEVKRLLRLNRELEFNIKSETFWKEKWEERANKWQDIYKNNLRRANGYEPKDLTTNFSQNLKQ
jgi:hypothetical protein